MEILAFDVLKGRFHLSDHLVRLSRSSCSDESEMLVLLDIFASSANSLHMFVTSVCMSFMNPALNLVECHSLLLPILTLPLQYKSYVFCYGEMILSSVTDFLIFQTPLT